MSLLSKSYIIEPCTVHHELVTKLGVDQLKCTTPPSFSILNHQRIRVSYVHYSPNSEVSFKELHPEGSQLEQALMASGEPAHHHIITKLYKHKSVGTSV